MENAIFTLVGMGVTFLLNLLVTWQKNQHDLEKLKLENNHKLTQETYQKIFQKKIEVYMELHNRLRKHELNLLTIGFIEHDFNEYEGHIITEITEDKINVSLINGLNDYFKDNIFYVSETLEKKFSEINLALQKNEELFKYEIYEGMIDYSNLSGEEEKNVKDFYGEHKDKILDLFKLIENEISILKKKINFD
ncbi:hypothetical protein [Arcobacter roscoffensis]|uniref:Uncharacterized protein n=1 Tax=Arcobacter roscoffensis TaxID=2961520 RepID=A0ABY5E299_9BACT|nr:hypothetical protein [Arcobacter roscoffensis]UTJ05850.1 hypothetical protein NJU99_11405 [Arcobacter roscoffensis]